MDKNKLGICSWCLPYEKEELFSFSKEMGLSGISMDFDYEVCDSAAHMDTWCRSWTALAEQTGMQFPIMAVNIVGAYGMSKAEKFADIKKILEKAVSVAAEIGAPCIHLPSFGAGEIHSQAELEQTIRCLEYAVKLGEKYHVQIGHESVLLKEMYARILENVQSPVFFLLYDNDNLVRDGQDPVVSYLDFAEAYKHAHIKTSTEDGMPEFLKKSEKFGGVGAVLDAFEKQNFSGWIILETDYRKLKDSKEIQTMISKDIAFLQNRS